MGNDTPLAVLSPNSQLLYNYFKQLFAQVTNPAIDPIWEEIVMSLVVYVGKAKNIIDETPQHCQKLKVEHPVLTNEEFRKIKNIREKGFKTKVISILFNKTLKNDFMKTIDRICTQANQAIEQGYTFIVLSDRGVNEKYAPVPALLATGAVHHYLIRKAMRTRVGIIVESGEPREVHHFALLFGYGAECINPYLAYDVINFMINRGSINLDLNTSVYNYIKAVNKGIKKILSKIGISTLHSYRGSQIFEALGLHDEVIDRCFAGTVSRIGGSTFDIIRRETLMRHKHAFPEREISTTPYLSTGGVYQWKKDGEFHLWNPESITAIQDATRFNDYARYKES